MNMTENEIRFASRLEALSNLPYLKEIGWVLYDCARCGISFSSPEPSTDTGAIICNLCEGDINNRGGQSW